MPLIASSPDCPFCERAASQDLLAGSELAAAFLDSFPVSTGHALVVPRRHAPGLFELTPDELAAVWALVPEVIRILTERHAPDGFNVGVNLGTAAGQTIPHAHVQIMTGAESTLELEALPA